MEKMSKEAIQKQQAERIKHLETAIKTFRKNIEKAKNPPPPARSPPPHQTHHLSPSLFLLRHLEIEKLVNSIAFGTRVLLLANMASTLDSDMLTRAGAFVTLFPAYTPEESNEAVERSALLMQLGCKEFCCAGPGADLLHDRLDALLEDAGELEVVTTAILDEEEACEYFVLAADGGEAKALLALVSDHPALEGLLRREMADAVNSSRF
jgi:hypothetical protein